MQEEALSETSLAVNSGMQRVLETAYVGISALAQLIAIHMARGITSTKELATLCGYSDRAIRKAKAELECRNYSSDAEPECRNQGADRNSGAGTRVPPQKEIPPTPPKEKLHYLEPTLEIPSCPTVRREREHANGLAEIGALNGSTTMIVETFAKWLNPWQPDLPLAHRSIADACGIYGDRAVRDAFAELKADHADGKLRAMTVKAFYGYCRTARDRPQKQPASHETSDGRSGPKSFREQNAESNREWLKSIGAIQ